MAFSLSRVLAVLVKEFTQLRRDRLTYAMILVMPIVQLMLFGYAINNDPRSLPTAVLAQDQGPMARSVVSALTNSGYFAVTRTVTDPAELDAMMARGQVQFAVVIPPDFSRRVVRGDRAQLLVEADASDPGAPAGRCRPWPPCPPRRFAMTWSGRWRRWGRSLRSRS